MSAVPLFRRSHPASSPRSPALSHAGPEVHDITTSGCHSADGNFCFRHVRSRLQFESCMSPMADIYFTKI